MMRSIIDRLGHRSGRGWLLAVLPLATVAALAGSTLTSRDSWETPPSTLTVSSLYDLVTFYEDMVDFHMPIATPAPYEPMWISGNPSVLVIDPNAPGWPSRFIHGLVAEDSHGVATYPIIVEQDDAYRYIYNADDELLVAMPLSKGYDRYAFLRERYPYTFDARIQDERTDWLLGVYDAQRMILQVTLMTPEGYVAWRTAVDKEAEAARLADDEAPMMLMQSLDFAVTDYTLDGDDVVLGWNPDDPAAYHAVERSLDLMGSFWTPVYWAQGTTNWLRSTSTNDADYAFYRVVEFDQTYAESDTSGSGLAAFHEYLLGTDPTKRDTSGDGIPDGAAVLAGGDPLHNSLNDAVTVVTYEYDEHDRLVLVYASSGDLEVEYDDAGNVSSVRFEEVTP